MDSSECSGIFPNPILSGKPAAAVVPANWTGDTEVLVRNAMGEIVKRSHEIIAGNQVELKVGDLTPGILFPATDQRRKFGKW